MGKGNFLPLDDGAGIQLGFDKIEKIKKVSNADSLTRPETPELKLLIALIIDVAYVLANPIPNFANTTYGRYQRNQLINERKNALDWIHGFCKSLPGFSFIEVCQHLNIEPDFLRPKLVEFSTRNKNLGRIFAEFETKTKHHRMSAA